MGGTVEVTSEPDRLTVFSVRLPVRALVAEPFTRVWPGRGPTPPGG